MWFIGVEVKNGACPPKKNPGSAPEKYRDQETVVK